MFTNSSLFGLEGLFGGVHILFIDGLFREGFDELRGGRDEVSVFREINVLIDKIGRRCSVVSIRMSWLERVE